MWGRRPSHTAHYLYKLLINRVDRASNTGPLCPLTKEEEEKIDSGAVFVTPYLKVHLEGRPRGPAGTGKVRKMPGRV